MEANKPTPVGMLSKFMLAQDFTGLPLSSGENEESVGGGKGCYSTEVPPQRNRATWAGGVGRGEAPFSSREASHTS